MTEEKRIMIPHQAGAVAPIEVEDLVTIVDAFDKFKSMVLKESDFWLDKKENKKRVKKSGWLKYALACNVSLEKIDEREVDKEIPLGSGNWVTVYHFDYRAIAPTGRYTEASGSASTDERNESGKMIHDTRSLAQTRAMNRAISHLVGGGEISAEEVEGYGPRKAVESEQVEKIREQARRDREERLAKEKAAHPQAEEPKSEEPEPVEEGPPGTVEEVKERLASHILGLDEWIVVTEYLAYYRVGKKKRLEEEMEYTVDELVKRMGGDWDKDANCWRIPKR